MKRYFRQQITGVQEWFRGHVLHYSDGGEVQAGGEARFIHSAATARQWI